MRFLSGVVALLAFVSCALGRRHFSRGRQMARATPEQLKAELSGVYGISEAVLDELSTPKLDAMSQALRNSEDAITHDFSVMCPFIMIDLFDPETKQIDTDVVAVFDQIAPTKYSCMFFNADGLHTYLTTPKSRFAPQQTERQTRVMNKRHPISRKALSVGNIVPLSPVTDKFVADFYANINANWNGVKELSVSMYLPGGKKYTRAAVDASEAETDVE